jgi:hypothetical protein
MNISYWYEGSNSRGPCIHELEIEYNICKGYPDTRTDPGEPDRVEFIDIICTSCDDECRVCNQIMADGDSKIEAKCLAEARDGGPDPDDLRDANIDKQNEEYEL